MKENNAPVTYRYKFSIEIMNEITAFSKIHQYDDRQTYKEAWDRWKEEQKDFIDTETERLTRLGYIGSVEKKMYKAGRYYFRKKNLSAPKEKQERRDYISINRKVLTAMDTHIQEIMSGDDFTPASGYTDFCERNLTILEEEICRICREDASVIATATNAANTKLLVGKFKKTYKNRYYLLSRSNN
jgi:hypothetical protein